MTGEKNDSGVRRMFGTDGIRGVANIEPMTPETVLRLGRAVGRFFQTDGDRQHKVLIGKDTRVSGYMIETALASGLTSMGVDVLLVGPMPTPGIAFLTRSMRADAGVSISASHNPFEDNGIKFFGPDAFKLPDADEALIEELMFGSEIDRMRPTAGAIGKARRVDDADGRYNVFLKSAVPREQTLAGFRLVIDCANGAAYRVAPTVLEELGAEVVAIGDQPDGFNINDGCGAMYTDLLRERVLREGAHAGIALDGDADRVIMVDELGAEVDGDRMMAILATHMKRSGLLRGDAVVGTVMSNLGLEVYLKEQGIGLLRANVGDRYVVEMMKETGCNLGGEQSGHLICLDNTTTGDGMISALSVLVAMQEADKPLSELHAAINRYPQVLINVAVQEKSDLAEEADICSAIDSARDALGEQGRVLVRYSGTQALARVMVEGAEHSAVEEHARAIADAIQARLG